MLNANRVASDEVGVSVDSQAALWPLASLAALYRQPFDAKRVTNPFAPPFDPHSLIEMLAAINARTESGGRPRRVSDLASLPFSALAFSISPSVASGANVPSPTADVISATDTRVCFRIDKVARRRDVRSDCGKSSLAKRMQSCYWPQEGQVMLDGRAIRQVAASELGQPSESIRKRRLCSPARYTKNLVMPQLHANSNDIVAAYQASEIHDVTEQLPQNYQTEIGESSIGLSGLARQRNRQCARLLKRMSVLIFDKAFSASIDRPAEQVAPTVNRLKGKMTLRILCKLAGLLLLWSEIACGTRAQYYRIEWDIDISV